MLPGQNLGLTPYTKYGSDPNASFLSHKNYLYDMKGSNPSAKGIIKKLGNTVGIRHVVLWICY